MNEHDGREEVRRILHGAVADVHPSAAGTTEVLARLDAGDAERGGRGWLTAALAAAAAVAVVFGGLAWLNHRAAPGQPTPASGGREVSVLAYYLGPTAVGPRLFAEHHDLHGVTASDAQAAVNQALGRPDDPDYRSGFPAGTTAGVDLQGDTVVVDFDQDVTGAAAGSGGAAADEAVQALVWTLDAVLERPVGVRFAVQGKPVDTVLGRHLDGPVTAGAADSVLAPVSVEVGEGAPIASGTTIHGRAAAFEGNVVWELRQGEQVVRRGYATANECCTLSPYAFRLVAPPGSYTLVVHDTDASGGEGNGVTSDTKDIVVP